MSRRVQVPEGRLGELVWSLKRERDDLLRALERIADLPNAPINANDAAGEAVGIAREALRPKQASEASSDG